MRTQRAQTEARRTSIGAGIDFLKKSYPKGFATLGESAMLRRQVRRATGKPREHRSPRKIDVTGKLAVASVSVVTLIRTDTTLDHSQKAEKV